MRQLLYVEVTFVVKTVDLTLVGLDHILIKSEL